MSLIMISVWGSGGAGKTTFSLALATELARRKQNVVVINPDTSPPFLPIALPHRDLAPHNSLGTLLEALEINFDALKGKIHIHPKSDRIGFMGLVSGETPITYKSFARETLTLLLQALDASPFDYVIFDCVANPVMDQLTLLSLETSNYVFRLVTPDIKGAEFVKGQMMWLKNSPNFNLTEQIRVLSPVHDVSPVAEISAVTGGHEAALPWSHEVMSKFIAGELMQDFKYRQGLDYQRQIELMTERIMS